MNARSVALRVALPVSGVCALVFGALAFAGGTSGGAVTVRSEPAEASVFVDGAFRGVTPLEVGGLLPGRHSVRIEKADFKPHFAALEAPGGTADLRLEPVSSGSLEVRSEPSGAEVYLDGRFRGVAPIVVDDVRAGPHVIRGEKTGHDPATVSALVSAGRREVVHIELDDRVLRYLEYAARTKPDDMTTFMELGHYSMVVGDTKRAADAYFRGIILSRRPDVNVNYRRKLEQTVKRDRGLGGRLGAELGAALDRLLDEHDARSRR